ncbi:RYamide receptor [Caerostris darwini]|uniref:RYamide receptor n=1 Tax=Caerostris darwini TaxID=1538125 RepID=A0AAV4S243_9ARAC|nr:RYamide receptor [Caerostris darwini]
MQIRHKALRVTQMEERPILWRKGLWNFAKQMSKLKTRRDDDHCRHCLYTLLVTTQHSYCRRRSRREDLAIRQYCLRLVRLSLARHEPRLLQSHHLLLDEFQIQRWLFTDCRNPACTRMRNRYMEENTLHRCNTYSTYTSVRNLSVHGSSPRSLHSNGKCKMSPSPTPSTRLTVKHVCRYDGCLTEDEMVSDSQV